MRCLACDKRLNDRESTRKYSSSGTFVDLCDRCFSTISDEVPDIEGETPDWEWEEEDGTDTQSGGFDSE
jgi:hypothetical protein